MREFVNSYALTHFKCIFLRLLEERKLARLNHNQYEVLEQPFN